jgi:hypothetical protein
MRMKKFLLNLSLTIFLIGAVFTNAFGQITTSGLKGLVVDEKNEPLAGATVVAVHLPSGTQYGVLTNADGRFIISNMRVGGPYQLTVSFVGYKQQAYNDIDLTLGNVADMNVTLSSTVTSLNEVIVSAGKNNLINSGRTGASINLSNDMVNSVPTVSRGLKDFTKVSPLANNSGSGTSFAGANNRYNQFAIDGLVNNDVFGLTSSGTNGGQAGIEPISLDAIEEFQINIAPYDVRQGGFTGGGINAVTKSGTNKFTGSAYFYGNNQSIIGKNEPINNTKSPVATQKDYQAGFTIGGPIIKNKLFFFLNGEITRKSYPLANVPGTTTSNITLDDINQVLTVLSRVAPSYDPGNYLNINSETNSNKILAKVNWNISDKHKLTLRHSYTYGENINISRTADALRFSNNGYLFPSTTNSTGLELNSIFGSNKSNRLMLGYTTVLDDRNPYGADFPTVLINLSGGRSITLGSEYSSVANLLKQRIFSVDDEFSIFKGKHTIILGTHNEFYHAYNLFVQNIFGSYAYNSLANFASIGTPGEVSPTYYAIGYSFDATDNPSQSNGAAHFNAMQYGVYAQDEYQMMKNLQITLGLRLDIPVFPDKPEANSAFNTAYAAEGVATGVLPKTRLMWAPRLGFNWDVFGNKTTQVRGGTGLFTGRVPFVWISNQFSNNGQLNGSYSVGSSASSASPITNPAGLKFTADPYSQKLAEDLGKVAGRGAINVVDPNLKFPQVFRSNIAVDQKLPWDMVGTVEFVYSKTYNNVNFIDLNRKVDPNFTFTGVDQRPRYFTSRVDANYDEIIKFENTNLGYSYNFVAMIQKQFQNGFNAQVSYTYGKSTDLNSGTSSVAYSNWRYVNNVYGLNDLRLTRSNFDLGSRITGLISYKKEYLKGVMSTQVSLFYNGQSGQPLSYIYNGDMNGDGSSNDMIYIPAKQSDINLVAITTGTNPKSVDQQWAELDAFIRGHRYLKDHRGQYAERNAARSPFQHQFDFRLLQEFKVKVGKETNRIQLSFDILNIGNMLNKKWGHSIYDSNQQFALINYKGQTPTNTNASSTPTFTYDGSGQTNGYPYLLSDFSSRWRGQIGLRYIFN